MENIQPSLLFHCFYWILIDCCQDSNIMFVLRRCSRIFGQDTSPLFSILPSIFLFSVFWRFRTISDKMIYGAASKSFPSCTIWIFVWRSTSRTIFLFIFSDIFETFFHRMASKSTICALFLDRVCFFIVFTGSWLTAVKI